MGYGVDKRSFTRPQRKVFERQKQYAHIKSTDQSLKEKHPELATHHSPLTKLKDRRDKRIINLITVLSILIGLAVITVTLLI